MFYVGVMYISPPSGDGADAKVHRHHRLDEPSSRTNGGGYRLAGSLRRLGSLLLLEAIELDGAVQ